MYVSVCSLWIPVLWILTPWWICMYLCLRCWFLWCCVLPHEWFDLPRMYLCLHCWFLWCCFLLYNQLDFLISLSKITVKSMDPKKKDAKDTKIKLVAMKLLWRRSSPYCFLCSCIYLNVLCNSVRLVRIVSRLLHCSLNPCNCVSVRLMNYKRFQCYYVGGVRDAVMRYDLCYTNSAGLGRIKIVCWSGVQDGRFRMSDISLTKK